MRKTAMLRCQALQDPADGLDGYMQVQEPTAVLMRPQMGDTAAAYAAAAAPPCAAETVSDDMLVEHLSLANAQLRQVIEAAGLDPIPSLQPLRDLQHSIQQQHPKSSRQRALQDDELLAALAEENYQLRQLVQQLQLQQQYRQVQQQHEAAMAAAQGDPLELDRFSDTVTSPANGVADVAAAAAGISGSSSSSSGASTAARAEAVEALDLAAAPSTAALSAAAPLHGPIPITPHSPAVMAAGILVPPSTSAVQLAEAEAAAQVMTQAVIQAEAAAVFDSMTWLDGDAVDEGGQEAQQQQLEGMQQPQGNQQLTGVVVYRPPVDLLSMTPAAGAVSGFASSTELLTAGDGAAVADNSSSFGLLKLPKLLLPARALRRSFSRGRSSDAGSEASHASNITPRSNVTPGSAVKNVTTARPGTAAADSTQSVASSHSSGLKQLANDMLLMPSCSQFGAAAGGAVADDEVANAASQTASAAAHADAAATVAAAAAAQLWYPAAVAVLRDTAVGTAAIPSSTAAGMAVHGINLRNRATGFAGLQQQQLHDPGPIAQLQGQLKGVRVNSSSALPPAPPVQRGMTGFGTHMASSQLGPAATAAQAAAAAAAFAGQHPALLQDQRQVSEDLPALPKLRLPSRLAPAHSTGDTAAAAAADCSSSGSSPCSDSGFFRDASAAAHLDDSTASLDLNALPPAAGSTAAQPPPLAPAAAAAGGGGSNSGLGLHRRYRGSEVFSSNGRISSDFFGARISMDGSVGLPPRVSLTGNYTTYSSRDQLSDLAGWYGVSDAVGDAADGTITRTDTLTSNLNSSEFLGVSYQQSWQQQTEDVLQQGSAYDSVGAGASAAAAAAGAADALNSSDQQWLSLPKLQLPGRRLLLPQQRRCSTSSSSKDQQYRPQRQQQLSDTGTVESIGSLVPAPDIPDNFFYQDYLASDSIGSMRGLHSVSTLQGTQSASAAAGASSISRPGSEVTLADIDVLQQQISDITATAAADCSKPPQQLRPQQHLALPDLSLLDLNVQAHAQQPTPVIGQMPTLTALYGDVVDSSCAVQQQEEPYSPSSSPQLQAQQQQDPVPVAPGVAPALTAAAAALTTGGLNCGISSEKLRQLLTDLAIAQEHQQQLLSAVTPRADGATSTDTPSTARSNGVLTMQTSGPLSPLAVPPAPAAAAAGAPAGAVLQRQLSAGIPPKSPSREIPRRQQQQQHDPDLAASATAAAADCGVFRSLQRALSAGSMGSQLPPKWGARSGSSGNLSAFAAQQQQQQQLSSSIRSPRNQQAVAQDQQCQQQQRDDLQRQQQPPDAYTHGAAGVTCLDRCRSITPTAAAAGGTAFRLSPGGGLHSRLRVVTAVRPPPSNGSNSDVETNSTTTTPLHHRGGHTRNNSSSSIPFRPGSGLASITVPPSPASSGVRYVPASPRVVGFDCPSTPQSILRSPSCRSDYSNAESAAAAAGGVVVNHYSVGHLSFIGVGGLCSSGSSTPRRQPTSPGLLHQALARQGHIPGCSSGSSTPLGCRRAASTSAVPHPGFIVTNSHNSGMNLPPAPLGNLPSAFAAHASSGGLFHDSSSNTQQQRQSSHSIMISPRGTAAGPLGVRSPPGAAAAGVHGRARSCSSTLLNILTGGAMQQQMGLQHVNTHYPYIQQPQPLPLQQQHQQQQGPKGEHPMVLRVHSGSEAAGYVSDVAAVAAGATDSTAYGSAVEDAVDGELRAAAAADHVDRAAQGQDHVDHGSDRHDGELHQQQQCRHHQQQSQHQQHMGACCVSRSPRAVAAAAAHMPAPRRDLPSGARSKSPLSRSVSPTLLSGGSSSSSGQLFVAQAASPARSSQDNHHPAKLSRFGQMAAAAAEAQQITTAGSAASSGAAHAAAIVTGKPYDSAAAAGPLDRRSCADLSNASSVASPDTPAIVDAAPAGAVPAGSGSDSGTDVTPTAAEAAASNGFGSVVNGFGAMSVEQQVVPAAASVRDYSMPSAAPSAALPAGGAAVEVASVDTEPQTPQQQQQQAAEARAGGGTAAGAKSSSSSAALSKLCSQKHHEVVVASGRRAAQGGVPYVPAYMSSNAADALRRINAKRAYSGDNSSTAAHCDGAGSRAAETSTSNANRQHSTAAAVSWDAQIVYEPVPQHLMRPCTRVSLDGVLDQQQQQQPHVVSRDMSCVTPGLVKSRVRSWSQSLGQVEASAAAGAAAAAASRGVGTGSAATEGSLAGAAALPSSAAVVASAGGTCSSKRAKSAGGSAASVAMVPKPPAAVAAGPGRRKQPAKRRTAAPPATATAASGNPFGALRPFSTAAVAALPATNSGIVIFGASSPAPAAAAAPSNCLAAGGMAVHTTTTSAIAAIGVAKCATTAADGAAECADCPAATAVSAEHRTAAASEATLRAAEAPVIDAAVADCVQRAVNAVVLAATQPATVAPALEAATAAAARETPSASVKCDVGQRHLAAAAWDTSAVVAAVAVGKGSVVNSSSSTRDQPIAESSAGLSVQDDAVMVGHNRHINHSSDSSNTLGGHQRRDQHVGHGVMQLGVLEESDALDKARARQQQLLKQRQLMRQQQQLRRRQEIAEWAEQQRKQQLELLQQQQHSEEGAHAGLDDVRRCATDQHNCDMTVGGDSTTVNGAVTAAAAAPAVSSIDGAGVTVIASADALLGSAAQVAPCTEAAGAAAAAVLDTQPLSTALVSAVLSDNDGLPCVGLTRAASYCPSVDSNSNGSWAAWSTSSSINRCPKLEWWGREQGPGGAAGYFSERRRRRQLQQQQGSILQQGGSGSRQPGAGLPAGHTAAAAGGRAPSRAAGRAAGNLGDGRGWFQRLRLMKGSSAAR